MVVKYLFCKREDPVQIPSTGVRQLLLSMHACKLSAGEPEAPASLELARLLLLPNW